MSLGARSYTDAREALRAAELDLMQQREAVAAMRRDLPPGPVVDDYEFDSTEGRVRLSQLFGAPARPLVLYHFMLGKRQEQPCPMCAMWADGWNAVADHVAQSLDLVLVSAAPIDRTLAVARERGWTGLRWVSAEPSSFKVDIGGEDEDGNQLPFISVYELEGGQPRLTYSGGAHITGEWWRGVDLLSPVWHLLDLTRAGRGDWMPQLQY